MHLSHKKKTGPIQRRTPTVTPRLPALAASSVSLVSGGSGSTSSALALRHPGPELPVCQGTFVCGQFIVEN